MRPPDALTILRLLRRNEAEVARQRATIALADKKEAEAKFASVAESLATERDASDKQHYASWLPIARAKMSTAEAELESKNLRLADALEFLASSRTAEKVIEDEIKARFLSKRSKNISREQKHLDDFTAIRK